MNTNFTNENENENENGNEKKRNNVSSGALNVVFVVFGLIVLLIVNSATKVVSKELGAIVCFVLIGLWYLLKYVFGMMSTSSSEEGAKPLSQVEVNEDTKAETTGWLETQKIKKDWGTYIIWLLLAVVIVFIIIATCTIITKS